jgi:hypothetical protein
MESKQMENKAILKKRLTMKNAVVGFLTFTIIITTSSQFNPIFADYGNGENYIGKGYGLGNGGDITLTSWMDYDYYDYYNYYNYYNYYDPDCSLMPLDSFGSCDGAFNDVPWGDEGW